MPNQSVPRSSDFGQRLRRLRLARNLTQQQVANAVGSSQRAMVYYEKEGKIPPAAILTKMAAYFGVTVEEILTCADAPKLKRPGVAPDLANDPEDRRLWRQFQRLKKLSEHDRTTVLRMLNSLADTRTANA